MTDIVDQYNDPTFVHLHVLTKDRPLAREMLKTASFDKKTAAELPSSAFAWPETRRFAIHSKEDTLASLLYREKCASVPPHVDAMLEKAAQIYGLGDHMTVSTKTAGIMDGGGPTGSKPRAQAPGIGAYEGGQAALDSQGWFRAPDSGDIYLSDANSQKLQSNDPAQIQEVMQLTHGKTASYRTKRGSSATRATLYALPEDERLPINTAPEVKLAEHVLNRDFERLPLEKRAEAYSRLTGAARAHDVELSDFTLKMAGMVACSSDVLRDALETRATAAHKMAMNTDPSNKNFFGPTWSDLAEGKGMDVIKKNWGMGGGADAAPAATAAKTAGQVARAFDKMASELIKAPPILRNRKDLTKLAGVIHELDKKAGLDRYYDRKLLDPMQTVFNTNIKLGEDMCDVAGTPVACKTLMELPPRVWDMLDAPEMKELAEQGDAATFKQVFETLPLDMKVALKAHLE